MIPVEIRPIISMASKELTQEIVRLRQLGLSQQQIANRLGTTRGIVRYALGERQKTRTPDPEGDVRRQLALRQRKYTIIEQYKQERGCQRCPERDLVCLDLHHVDASQKHPKLTDNKAYSYKTGGKSRWSRLTYEEIVAELNKCEVLCSNCHRKEEHDRRQRATS